MTPQQTTWGAIETGHIVKDGNGKSWRVVKLSTKFGRVKLVDREGLEKVIDLPHRERPVTLMVPSTEEAVATIQRIIGGRIVEAA